MTALLDWLWNLLAAWCVPPWALHLSRPLEREHW